MLFGGQRGGQPAPVPVVQVAGGNPAWDTDTTNRHCQETKCYLQEPRYLNTHNYSTLFFARNMSRFSYYFRYTADSSYYYFSIIDSLCQANFILICSKFDQKCIL